VCKHWTCQALRCGCGLENAHGRHSSKDASHVSQHTMDTVREAYCTQPDGDAQLVAHTQHSPLPIEQLPVNDCTAHGADSLATFVAASQLQVSPHTATVGSCATWMHASGCGCPSSPPPCHLRQCRHGQHQDQPGERPWRPTLWLVHKPSSRVYSLLHALCHRSQTGLCHSLGRVP